MSEILLESKSLGKILRWERKESLILYGENENLRIDVLWNKVLRFYFSKNKEWKHLSFVVKEISPSKDFSVEEKEEIILRTKMLRVTIDKNSGKISIYNKDGDLILSDYEDYGYRIFKNRVYSYKEIKEERAFLGFGERTGNLNKKGKRLTNWNTDNPHHYPNTNSLYQSHPFFLAWNPKRSYGIFFDNTFRTYFDMGRESEEYYYFYAEDGELDYYFFYGSTPKEVLELYTELTGRYYLPPLWALGYQQSRWSYATEEEVRILAETFREKKIPCDVIYLDIDYMEDFKVFTINNKRFPNFQGMIEDLSLKGFKIIPIIDPGVKVDVNYDLYKEGIEKDLFCKKSNGEIYTGYVWPGKCVFPDFVRKEVREWWEEKQREMIDLGISGFWNDMNEPSSMSRIEYLLMRLLFYHLHFKEPPFIPQGPWEKEKKPKEFYKKTLSSDVLHGDKREFPHHEIHNVYGLLMVEACFEGWKKAKPNFRPLIVTRAGFSGIQKFSAVWTGDNKSTWEHLYMSLPMLQNLSLSGVPFVGADVGGFWRDCNPELFIRWMELGTFYPYFRNHSAMNTKNQEPWSFGENVEKIVRNYISLRYKLLPYIYSLFWEAKEKGIPPLRSLILEFPEDPEGIIHEDEFLLGPNLLIAPIYREGERKRRVYLPKGDWYDFWTGEKFTGPNIFEVSAPLEIIPVFVKGGSIIPVWEFQNYVGEKEQEDLELRVYDGEGEFIFYEDDGFSWNYERGEYNLLKFSLSREREGYILSIEYLHHGYKSKRKRFRVVTQKGKIIEVEEEKAEKIYFSP